MSESVLDRIRRINASPPAEQSIALRVSVLVAVLAAAGSVLHQDVGGVALRLACIVGIPAGFVFSYLARNRDRFWLKVVLAAGLLAAFVNFLGSLRTLANGGSASDIQIPLAQLFLWVQLLHSMDVPARRDLMFSLVSSLTLILAGAVLSVSLDFAPWLVLWALAALVSLVLAHRRELAVLPSLASTTSAARATSGSVLRPVLGVVVIVGLLATATLLVVPASGTSTSLAFPSRLPAAVRLPVPGGLSNPSLGAADPARSGDVSRGGRKSFGYFGFSDSLDTSVRGRPDDSLVLRVKAPAPDFWRGQTFDTWDGRQWTQSDVRPRPLSGGPPIEVPPTTGDVRTSATNEFVQTFYVERPGPNLVFGAYAPNELYFPGRTVFQLTDGSVRSATEMPKGTVYTTVSRRPAVTAGALRDASGPSAPATPHAITSRYLELPSSSSLRTRALARDVTKDAPTTYDKVLALEGWMAHDTRYSLDPPPLPGGADAVDQFLFVDKVGFCEQIGTSLVVMLRSLGIPARLAVGYVPGERNPFTGLWEVRASDAHAWAEVWFPGVGWQAFDPTAEVPLAGDAGVRAAGSGLLPYLLRHVPHPSAATIELAVALGAAALLVVVVLRVAGWHRRRRARARPTWAAVHAARLERVGARLGAPRRPEQTLQEYARVLRAAGLPAADVHRVVDAIDAEAFSGTPLGEHEREDVEAALGVLVEG